MSTILDRVIWERIAVSLERIADELRQTREAEPERNAEIRLAQR